MYSIPGTPLCCRAWCLMQLMIVLLQNKLLNTVQLFFDIGVQLTPLWQPSCKNSHIHLHRFIKPKGCAMWCCGLKTSLWFEDYGLRSLCVCVFCFKNFVSNLLVESCNWDLVLLGWTSVSLQFTFWVFLTLKKVSIFFNLLPLTLNFF